MTSERWQQLQELVDQATKLPLAQRGPWLDQACAGDLELREQAQGMLAAFDTLDDSLEQAVGAAAVHVTRFSLYAPGDRIGPYRIVAELGEGGMGVVYRGERADDQFRQAVAIKVVRAGFGSAEVLTARFRAERQILASINHPHIARLLDGGVTATGLPYLVMEYIEGVDLLTFASTQQLALAARLELFEQIASAVQYAHQNLIVHRDLKPANILISSGANAKLLDFGIAKLLDTDSTAHIVVETLAAERLMTPEYASPEQARGERITTSTDVYGLGLLLYELLTGQRPFRIAGLSRAEAERLICEVAPVSPSAVGLAPEARPQGRIPSDLDRIVQKALHKQPERRYASVAGMQADLARYRAGFPVLARPDSVAYRTSRFVSRHPWSFAAALTFLLVIVGFSIMFALQAERARREAASADAVSQYLIGLFDNAQPDATQGRDVSARALLDQGTTQLHTDWRGEPRVKARLLASLGSVYYQLGDFAEARNLLRESKDLYQHSGKSDSPEVADVANSLGEAELDGGDYPASLRDYSESVRIFEKISPQSAALADAMDGLSGILWKVGRYAESEQYHRKSIAMASSVLGPDARMTLVDKNNYAVLLVDMGRYRDAEAIHRQVLETRRKLFGPRNSHTASSMCNLAVVLLHMGRLDEARRLLEESLAQRRALYPGGHPNIGISLGYLSAYHLATGALQPALAEATEALAIARKFDGDGSLDVAHAQDALGEVYLKLGRYDQARLCTARALAIRQENDPLSVPELSESYDHLGVIALAEHRLPEAARDLQRALAMRSAFYGEHSDRTAWSQVHVGQLLLAEGKPQEAASLFSKALTEAESIFGHTPHPLTQAALDGSASAAAALDVNNAVSSKSWKQQASLMQAALSQQ